MNLTMCNYCKHSVETISLLLDHILKGERVESSIVGGIQVLLALIDVHKIWCVIVSLLNFICVHDAR